MKHYLLLVQDMDNGITHVMYDSAQVHDTEIFEEIKPRAFVLLIPVPVR